MSSIITAVFSSEPYDPIQAQNWLGKGGAHLQCVYNHCVKLELNPMKAAGVTNYTKYPYLWTCTIICPKIGKVPLS